MLEKFDWNDITIIPEVLSSISSRREITPFTDGKLPLFTAPMDMVIDGTNVDLFEKQNINICLPRHVKYETLRNDDYFYSYGLDEIIHIMDNDKELPKRVLIDIANAHLKKLWEVSKAFKERWGSEKILMVGNIANPETYRRYCDIGVDYVRCGIGGGSACTTSANVSIHYPMASLVNECYNIGQEYPNPTKIVADGGFRNFSDVIKALALGADYVMIGSLFNKCLESCSDTYIDNKEEKIFDYDKALEMFKNGETLFKYYRGMSTKEVQRTWDKKELKTSEGITKFNRVEYTLSGWVENFTDYLKSAMSYSDARDLTEFIGQAHWVKISDNAFKRFDK